MAGRSPIVEPTRFTLSPMQQWYFHSRADEVFQGSARGPGKTFAACLKEMILIRNRQDYRALIFRLNLTEIKDTIMVELKKADRFLGGGAYFVEGQEPHIDWPETNSRITLSAAERTDHVDRHQGANFPKVIVDEAQKMQPDVLGRMSAIARSTAGEPDPQFVYLANPTGPGHEWLKQKFVNPARAIDPLGNVVHDPMYWTNPLTGVNVELNQHWKFKDSNGNTLETILGGTDYNPVMDAAAYHRRIGANLSNTMRKAWIENDWDMVAGQFFPEVGKWLVDFVPIDPGDRVVISIDPGRKTGVVWAAYGRDGTCKIFDAELYMGLTADRVAPLILEKYPNLTSRATFVMDEAANAGNHAHPQNIRSVYRDYGINATTKRSERINGWEIVRTYGNAGKLLIDQRSASLLVTSLSALVSKENDPRDCDKWHGSEEGLDGDHLADSLRYNMTFAKFMGSNWESENQPIDISNNEFIASFYR